ncbi:MAG: hypothetical protein A2Z02_03120 [Chloroflexi bacterium RBG_16_48_7]|nr:MAG: hypothetical protein A2Z02_03120 [Chloroflexi bacterium RBG_16_48_7]
MNENNTPEVKKPKANAGSLASSIKGFLLGQRGKTALLVLVGLIAVGITVDSSIKYEARTNTGAKPDKPVPTYTGSAPLSITSLKEALESNNDFILVITPCSDDALNTSVTGIVVEAGNKIRSTDKIYVGVFTMSKDESLAYPTVLTRYLAGGTSSIYQFTFRTDVTLDKIYDVYLSRKFLR